MLDLYIGLLDRVGCNYKVYQCMKTVTEQSMRKCPPALTRKWLGLAISVWL